MSKNGSVAAAPDNQLPEEEQVEDFWGSHVGPSMKGLSFLTSSVSAFSILTRFHQFNVTLAATDKVYLSCWNCLPRPPIYELLKVPII